MTQIIATYSADPGFPAKEQNPAASRTLIGTTYCDAIGGTPTQADLNAYNAPNSDAVRKKTFTDDQQIMNWTNQLAGMTSADIDAWFAANVTTNAQAIAALKNLAKIVSHQLKTP